MSKVFQNNNLELSKNSGTLGKRSNLHFLQYTTKSNSFKQICAILSDIFCHLVAEHAWLNS